LFSLPQPATIGAFPGPAHPEIVQNQAKAIGLRCQRIIPQVTGLGDLQ